MSRTRTNESNLARWCILAGCPPGGTVLDPFMGSGTTLRVAIGMGMGAIGIEINAEYCEIARRSLGLLGVAS